MTNHLLCCDWGTSFLRLQLVNLSDYQCVGEIRSAQGIAATFDAWRKTSPANGVPKAAFFRQQLQTQVDALARTVAINLTGLPMMISGMASSSIGMEEVPYATLPFPSDGSCAGIRYVAAQPDFPHDSLLIAGVRSDQDVMRGEETQLIGLLALLGESGGTVQPAKRGPTKRGPTLFVFPGTHSKHLYIEDGQLIRFATFMTGELFDLMANHSILADSVDLRGLTEFSDGRLRAFKLGVARSTVSSVLTGLFTTRTNQLFDKLTKTENAFFLSGLLIGSELSYLTGEPWPIVLCSGSKLATFYELAIEALALADRTTVISAELIDRAASIGQVLLFQNQPVNQTAR